LTIESLTKDDFKRFAIVQISKILWLKNFNLVWIHIWVRHSKLLLEIFFDRIYSLKLNRSLGTLEDIVDLG